MREPNHLHHFPIAALAGCATLLACAAATLAASAKATLAAGKPNILFIFSDDLSYRDLSAYGQTAFSTPHLDRLANNGIRFSHAYSGASACAPSRASLMTKPPPARSLSLPPAVRSRPARKANSFQGNC